MKKISKEVFVERINKLLEFNQENDDFQNFINKFTDGFCVSTFGDGLSSEYIGMLNDMLGLDYEDDTISWWLYEFQNEPENKKIWIDNKEYIVITPEQLYDALISLDE